MEEESINIEDIIHKILWGKSLCDVQDSSGTSHPFILRSLSIKENNIAQYLYDKEYKLALEAGLLKYEDLKKLHESMGLWTDQEETKIIELDKKIKALKQQIKGLEFFPSKKKHVEKQLKTCNSELDALYKDKAHLFSMTAENRAEEVRRRFIVMFSAETLDEQRFWPNEQAFLDEQDIILVFNLAYAYHGNNIFPEAALRKVARSGAWRYRWTMAKTGADLFGKPIAEWSEMQNMLVYWSQYYDSVFESLERPSDGIIDNDAACDAWVDDQNKKHKNNLNKDGKNMFGTKKAATKKDHNEQFIMVDAKDKETIKKIQELNPNQIRRRLQEEHKIIQERGRIKEWDLRKGEYKNERNTKTNR